MYKFDSFKLIIHKSYFIIPTGFSTIEVILAVALFVIFTAGITGVMLQGVGMNRLGVEHVVATQYAAEGIEAARSIKNQAYVNLSAVNSSPRGINRVGNVWTFLGDNTNNTFSSGRYTRIIRVEDVRRDGVPPLGNIIAAGGAVDANTKRVTSTVTWNFTSTRPQSISLVTYLSDWKKAIIPARGGVLVYGDGGTTTDAMRYRILDGSTGTWGAVTTFPDFDTTATTKAVRTVRMFASSTRNEKIALTRHYNASPSPLQESIYAHVFNGTTWSSVQLTAWTATAFDTSNQGIKNFDGTYLNNGNFLVVYSDNTTTPKYRIWNGTSWSPNPPTAGSSTVNVGGIPTNVTLKNREGSNEAMLAVFDQSSDTNTTYFNGSTWSAVTEHATTAPTNTKEFSEFAWSAQDPLQGALIYTTATNDRGMNMKIWTANGSGSGSWGATVVDTANQGTLGAMEIDGGRKGAEEFLACNKDASNDIYCFRGTTVPAWTSPTNNIMTATTDTGIQRSFDLAYDGSTGTEGIVVYSDTTAIPKLRKYTASTNSFDAAATSLTTLGAAVETVKMRNLSESDDIMIMMANTNNDLFTLVWDGSTNVVYTTPAGKAFTAQGINGSSTTEFWYGFAWDRF